MTGLTSQSIIKDWLAHPLTRGLDIDDPRTTQLRRQIIQGNSFLHQIYEEWYVTLAAALPEGPGAVLELGSGPGFLDEYIPGLITSEVFSCPRVRTLLDGQRLPFRDCSLRGVAMNNVLHHLAQPRAFLAEAARCLRPGGVLVMNEPWVTRWSRLIYGRLHHEAFEPAAREPGSVGSGPLSTSNSAVPWILFERDRVQFEQEFPELELREIQSGMPFRYLVSGGVSMRALMPGWSFALWRRIEDALRPWMKDLGMFALIVLDRNGAAQE